MKERMMKAMKSLAYFDPRNIKDKVAQGLDLYE